MSGQASDATIAERGAPLRRPRRDRLVAGVAAGIAARTGVDVVVVRVLFVVTAILANGLGLVAYLFGWILIPADDAAPGPPDRGDVGHRRDPLFWVGIGLLIIGAILLLHGPFGLASWVPILVDPGIIGPLVLIGFGVALWRSSERSTATQAAAAGPAPVWERGVAAAAPPTAVSSGHGAPPAVSPIGAPASPDPRTETMMTTDRDPTSPPEGAQPWQQPEGAPPQGQGEPPWGAPPPQGQGEPPWGAPPPQGQGEPPWGAPPPAQPAAWAPPPVPERERSVLGQITVGLALVVVGVLWLLGLAGVLDIGFGRLVAAALLVIGLGLLVGSFAGRARWLIVVGVLLLPLVLVAQLLSQVGFTSWLNAGQRGAVGEIRTAPATPEEVRDSYQLGAGSHRLDLAAVAFEEDTLVALQVGAGEIRVNVPEDVTVDVRARVGAGEIRILDEQVSGIGLERRVVDEVPGAVTLELDVQVGFGEVRITRAAPGDAAGSDRDDAVAERSDAGGTWSPSLPRRLVPAA